MATKLGRTIASLDGLLPIMSYDPLITWPCEIRGSLTEGGSAHKHLSRHRLLVVIFILQKTKNSNLFDKNCTQENSNVIFNMKKVDLDES